MTSRRPPGPFVVLLLVAAACGEPAVGPTSSAPTTVSTTTSTSSTTTAPSTTTTTTTVPGALPVLETTRFTPGTRYRGVLPQLSVEYELQFRLDGWRVRKTSGSLGDFIHLMNWEQDLATGVEANLVLFMSELPIGELADWYATHPSMAEATQPVETTVAGLPAYQVDVLVSATDDPIPFDACFGLPLSGDTTGWRQNIGGCTWARVWVVDVDGIAVTAYVSAAFEDLSEGGIAGDGEGNLHPDMVWQFEDFQPLLGDFIDALSFCTEVTPCAGSS